MNLKKCKCIKSDTIYIFNPNKIIKDKIYQYKKIKKAYYLYEENDFDLDILLDILSKSHFNELFIDLQIERKQKLLKINQTR